MGFFNEFPHTRTYDNDLGWIIKTIKALEENLENFIKLNTVKYADPIQWNISSQYEANTVVIDALTGVAYISTQPVPSGVAINNTDYWTPVFTLDLVNLNKNITLRNDGDNHNATFASVIGDWLIVGGQLYKVIQDISLYTAYVVGYNIQIYSVELFVKDYLNQVLSIIGDLNDLNTTDKDNIVDALNEVLSNVGDLQDLNTTDKDNIVDALNEVLSNVGDLQDLNTTNKDSAVDAINEVLSKQYDFLTPDDFTGTDSQKLQACMNALQLTGGIIVIDRSLILDSDVTLGLATDDVRNNIKVIGLGNVTITLDDCSFIGATDDIIRSCGGVQFINLTFVGDGSNDFMVTDHLLRMTFIGCLFNNFENVFLNNFIMQSYVIDACVFLTDVQRVVEVLTVGRVFDVNITNSRAESILEFVEFNTTDYNVMCCENLNIINCCVEGLNTRWAIRLQCCRNVNILNNYFEANINTIKMDECINSIGIHIENNLFEETGYPSNKPIILPATSNSLMGIIAHNTYIGTGDFISVAGAAVDFIYIDVHENYNQTIQSGVAEHLRADKLCMQEFTITKYIAAANSNIGIDFPLEFPNSVIGNKRICGVIMGDISASNMSFTLNHYQFSGNTLIVNFSVAQTYTMRVTVIYL